MSIVERTLDHAVVKLDDSVLRDIRQQLGVAGVVNCASFVLVELCERGLLTAVVDAGTGVRLVERSDDKLSLRMLDLAVADHLVRAGRVERPESAEWAGELIELVTALRTRLATTDGAFAMGTDHIGLLRVSRRDVIAALHPHLMAAQSLWQAAALNAELPVGAIVFMPDHLQWPGLFATLAQLAPIPAVALQDPATHAAHGPARHGSDEKETADAVAGVVAAQVVVPEHGDPDPFVPGSVVVAPVVPDAVRIPDVVIEDEVVTAAPAPEAADAVDVPVTEPAAEHAAGQPELERETGTELEPEPVVETAVVAEEPAPDPVADPVSPADLEPTPVFASLAFGVPDVGPASTAHQQTAAFAPATPPHQGPSFAPMQPWPPAGLHPGPGGPRFHSTHEHDVYFGSVAERGPISVHDHRDVKNSGGPRHYSPPGSAAGSTSPEARRVHNRRLLIGAAAVASSAAVGVIVLTLPWIDNASSGSAADQVITAQTAQPPGSTAPTQSSAASRPPIDTGPARLPAAQYTTPPPAPPNAQAPTTRVPPRRATPARPRQRSIPNPIPGLPPILLP